MFLAHYTYSRPSDESENGKISKSVNRIINAETKSFAESLIHKIHEQRGEKVEGIIDLEESFSP